jgi:uncharacterized protein
MGIEPAFVLSGFCVGALVGLTGVGGGSLMTPLLVLVFGINVPTAVGTDLLFAAATKTVGVAVHGTQGTVDWRVTRRLAAGSLPAAVLTLLIVHAVGVNSRAVAPYMSGALGGALIATAAAIVARRWLDRLAARGERLLSHAKAPTVALGSVLGVLVSLSSVGAGAIGMTALVMLYPRLPIARLVGSDIAHAVPLTLVAGIGYWLLGSIDFGLLFSLLLGSIPGIALASRVSARVPEFVLRPVLATTLAAVGVKMLG